MATLAGEDGQHPKAYDGMLGFRPSRQESECILCMVRVRVCTKEVEPRRNRRFFNDFRLSTEKFKHSTNLLQGTETWRSQSWSWTRPALVDRSFIRSSDLQIGAGDSLRLMAPLTPGGPWPGRCVSPPCVGRTLAATRRVEVMVWWPPWPNTCSIKAPGHGACGALDLSYIQ